MLLELLFAALLGQQAAPPSAAPASAPANSLDYDFYKARVQPLFIEKPALASVLVSLM